MTTAIVQNPISLDKDGAPLVRSVEEAFRLAEMVFQSGLIPPGYRNAQAVLLCWQYGQELGLSRMQSLYNIAVINNRPTIYGKALPGIVQSKGVLEKFVEHIEGEGDNMVAICTVKRKGMPDECTKRFSWADAKRAGLTEKQTWKQYPRDLLGYKARARAFNTLFGDVLCGLNVYEDVAEVLQVEKNERVSEQPPAEVIDDPLMKQIGATEVPAEPKKRTRKAVVVETGNASADTPVIDMTPAPEVFVPSEPITEESALAAENAHALGVPPEDIPPTKPVNSPGIAVKDESAILSENKVGIEVRRVSANISKVEYKCRACRDSQKNSKGGPCPLCAPKKFEPTKEEKKESKPTERIVNQAETKGPPVVGMDVLLDKATALGKGLFKYQDDEGNMYYSNAPAVKSVFDANIGERIHIGVQDVDGRPTIVSARQIV